MVWGVGAVKGAGQPTVALRFEHPMGETVLFFEATAASQLVAQITDAIAEARRGSLIVPNVVLPMNGDGT
jgi:hypothetical protein